MFEFSEKLLGAVQVITPKRFQDDRGLFVKTFHEQLFLNENIIFDIKESFYTVSKKNVIRGMHFQVPQHDHNKLVYVPSGKIRDIVLDIRNGSPSFGRHVAIELESSTGKMVFIPKGFAHGFIALETNTMVTYMVDSVHSPAHDHGIHWNSFGADWSIKQPIVSEKDQKWKALADYASPFNYVEA